MDREQRVVGALIALADTLTEDFDPLDFLYELTERSSELLGAAAGGVLLSDRGRLELTASNSARIDAMEALQAQAHEGPGHDAFTTGEEIFRSDLQQQHDRWPRTAACASELGLGSACASPIQLQGRRIGALTVFGNDSDLFSETDRHLVRGLADMAAVSLLTAEALSNAQERIGQQHRALQDRGVVEQAKGMLAERLDISPEEAFGRLRRYARSHNAKLRDVAQRFLHGGLSTAGLSRSGV